MFNTNNHNWFGMNNHNHQQANPTPPSMINHAGNMSANNLHQMNGNNLQQPQHSHHTNASTNQNIYLRKRSVSNSNPALDRPLPAPDIPIQVEYEVAVPFVSTYRHTPYHSLWDLHEWWVVICVRSVHYFEV